MKTQEFIDLYSDLKVGAEVKIRYFTYNKNDYIDIIGRISNFYGVEKRINLQKSIFNPSVVTSAGEYYICIEYIGTYKYHDNFKRTNFPKLSLFDVLGQSYCNMYSSQISFIKPASIRAFKIHQIKNRKG